MEYYDNPEEAFESLGISRTEKFSKRKGNKTVKNLLITVLKKKYQDEYKDLLDSQIKRYEVDEHNLYSQEEKEREWAEKKKP